MSLYEFSCDVCNSTFDALCKFSERDIPQSCPKCGNHQTKRNPISPFAIMRSSKKQSITEDKGTQFNIIDCKAYDCTGAGFKIKNASAYLENPHTRGCNTGIEAINSNLTIKNPKVE